MVPPIVPRLDAVLNPETSRRDYMVSAITMVNMVLRWAVDRGNLYRLAPSLPGLIAPPGLEPGL